MGRARTYSDEQIADAIAAAGGNLTHAARALEMNRRQMSVRVAVNPSLRGDLARVTTPRVVSDEQIADALRACMGVVEHAAGRLGIRGASLWYRVGRVGFVWPEGVPRRRNRRPGEPVPPRPRRGVTDEQIAAALVAAGGNRAAAARALGVTRQAVSARAVEAIERETPVA
jgi:transcriptional regulator with GAF, ATPase, and Fis domain